MPRLVDLAALSSEHQYMLGETLLSEPRSGKAPALCGWLESAENIATVAAHIGRFLVGPSANGRLLFWRYHDPRVMALTLSLFSPAQVEALLGPITAWRFASCRRWWSATGAGRAVDPLGGYRPAWPDHQQWASLDHSELIRYVLCLLLDQNARVSDALCLQYQSDIDRILHYAQRQFHLSKHDDLAEYAFDGVRYGNAFHRHPKLSVAWPRLARAEVTWSEVRVLSDDNDHRALDEHAQLQHLSRGGA